MRRGAYVGAVVGCLGWLVGLAAACLASGETGVLWRIALPGLAVSLGITGVFLLTSELALAAFGPGRELLLALLGELTFFVGVLILLVSHWIAPLIEAAPDLKAQMTRLGGVYRVPDVLPAAIMVAGVALLGFALARVRRRAG